MKTISYSLNDFLPEWASKIGGDFCMKSPSELFRLANKENGSTHLSLKCFDDCGARIDFAYYGTNSFLPNELNENGCIQFCFHSPKDKTEDTANNIAVDITKKGIVDSIQSFFKNAEKAVAFKKETMKDIRYLLEFTFENLKIEFIVRVEEDKTSILLFRLSESLAKITLQSEPKTLKDFLGTVYVWGCEIHLKAGNESADNPFIGVIFEWINDTCLKNNIIVPEKKPRLWVLKY